jgi:hypothetical protein
MTDGMIGRAPGRARLPDSERRRPYTVWLNPEEYACIYENAQRAGKDMPQFIRDQALEPVRTRRARESRCALQGDSLEDSLPETD